MSARRRTIDRLSENIRLFHNEEQILERGLRRLSFTLRKWALMLYRKFLEDDIKVRAESLAFLMLFSLLPLIAGLFYVLTLFTKFEMAQEAISTSMDRLMATFPPDHRTMILEYVLKFKDSYLESISGKSSSLGVFALLILVYVGLQTFNNVDKTLNFIWSSVTERPFLEKARNFIVTSIVGPFVLVASLSLPLVLRNLPRAKVFLESTPALYTFLNAIVPFFLIVGLFLTLYKFVPVRRVQWRAAATGALVAAVFLQASNFLIATYFKYGTNSAYGKAAGIPIIGFWIFLVWVIVILGAEVSYLYQNQNYYIREGSYHASVFEIECLLSIVNSLNEAHKNNKNPLSFDSFYALTRLDPLRLGKIVDFLMDEKYIVQSLSHKDLNQAEYVLARSLENINGGTLARQYVLNNRARVERSPTSELFNQSLNNWALELDQIKFS